MLQKKLKFIFIFILPICVVAQNTIGLPGVTNFSKLVYGGGLQNWKIRQDKNGIIYSANNEGLLTYDGLYWNLYPLPNKTIVRSIEITDDSRVYVGGQDEAGYFDVSKNGRLKYHSLLQYFPPVHKSFSDMWDIVSYKKEVFFRSNKDIYRYNGSKVLAYDPTEEWLFLGKCNNNLYAQDVKTGLMQWTNGYWKQVENQEVFQKNDPITGIISLGENRALITTLKSGIFFLDSNKLLRPVLENQKKFIDSRIYAACAVNSSQVALGTSNEGLIIIDHEGNIIQKISNNEGLQNNNVLSLLADDQGNIWLGLDNGIDMISYNSAIKLLNPNQQNGSGYAALVHNHKLYIGTTNGLYLTQLQDVKDFSFSIGHFQEASKGQNWKLAEINSKVLLGQHEGAFEIKEDGAKMIAGNTGFWNFNLYNNDSNIVAGTYSGLEVFDSRQGKISPSYTIPHFTESSRYVEIDKENNIWVSHPYHGIFKIERSENGSYSVQKFTEKDGLPALLNNHIFKLKGEIVAATVNGIYTFNKQSKKFEISNFYKNILGNQSIRYLKESPAGDVWFIHDKTLSVIDFSGKQAHVIPLPQLSNKILSGFEFVYPYDEANVFVSGENGFFHLNYEKYKKNIRQIAVQVRTVKISDGTDSLLFGGYFNGVNEKQLQEKKYPILPHYWKTIRFEFSANIFTNAGEIEYSFRLKGFDEKWSDWGNRTEKEYSNLDAGNYSFEVKVRNSISSESEVATYNFKMLPPWYLSKIAGIIYILFFVAVIYMTYLWLTKKFRLQRQKYEVEQARLKYIHDLEQSKTKTELVALQNEKLEADLGFKNAELAAAAMHLVKKGELLTKIKKDLTHVTKDMRNPETIAAIKHMVKKVGDDDKLDEEWEHFARHFDSVHSDYLVNLKAKHSNLTSNELKLCANLRMNLSSKEIAQLMNISVRGVEIGRYRLRKKLAITSDMNLFDYLMTI